ncbi:MAG: SDR family NAD(P)-dependent oxidoreductase [Bacteroidia bacterium]|nr:SDR family NAD(P)-dependent oxidoreductase [Bacteroidia bacterium]
MSIQYAVITGASQGLGKSFAFELASKRYNLILISLPNQNLTGLSETIQEQYGVSVICRETDLSISSNVIELTDWINKHYQVSLLINNAGVGGTKRFEEASQSYLMNMINLNITATTILTHQLLSNLKKQDKAYILNISSLSAFSPVGFKTIYPASKAYVHSFTRGLFQELKETNVFVSVVNPGAMSTNSGVSERISNLGLFGKFTLLEPDFVAKKCINQLFKKNKVIIVNPVSWLFLKILPERIKIPLLTNIIKKEIQ